MKIFKYLTVLLFIGLLSCDSDETNTDIGGEDDAVVLVNPFSKFIF